MRRSIWRLYTHCCTFNSSLVRLGRGLVAPHLRNNHFPVPPLHFKYRSDCLCVLFAYSGRIFGLLCPLPELQFSRGRRPPPNFHLSIEQQISCAGWDLKLCPFTSFLAALPVPFVSL